jgi:hypothetical protein
VINLENVLLRGDRASQPSAAATAEGSLYFVTDEGVTEQVRTGAWASYSATSAVLSSGLVVSGNIASGQVGGFHLSSGCVTSGRIASGQIGTNHLGSGAIVSGLVASGVVGTNHMGTNNHVAVVDRGYDEYTTNADIATAIPQDDSIPQVGEGTQILSVTITPKSATNRLRISFRGTVSASQVTSCACALFRDGAANAKAASNLTIASAAYTANLALVFEESAGSTSSTTYTLRVGPGAGTMRLNGNTSSREYGGAQRATLVIEELSP